MNQIVVVGAPLVVVGVVGVPLGPAAMANSITPELVRMLVLETIQAEMRQMDEKFETIRAEMRQMDEKVAKLEAKAEMRQMDEKVAKLGGPDDFEKAELSLEELKKQAKPYFNPGLAIAVDIAQQALQDATSMFEGIDDEGNGDLAKASRRLVETHEILADVDSGGPGWVPNKRMTARAYDRVRQARQLVHRTQPKSEQPVKVAALIVREIVGLQCCAAAVSGNALSFMAHCVEAYGRNLDSELQSQMHLSRSKIANVTVDRSVFDKSFPKLYGVSKESMTEEQLSELFSAYCTARDGRPSQRPGRSLSIRAGSRTARTRWSKSRGSRSPSKKPEMDMPFLGEPMSIPICST